MFLARRQAQQLTTQLLRKVFARLVYIARNYYYLCNSPGFTLTTITTTTHQQLANLQQQITRSNFRIFLLVFTRCVSPRRLRVVCCRRSAKLNCHELTWRRTLSLFHKVPQARRRRRRRPDNQFIESEILNFI